MAFPEEIEMRNATLRKAALESSKKVRLYKDSLTPDDDTDAAAFMAAEADFTGYVAQDATPQDPVTEPGAAARIDFDVVTFEPDGTGGGQAIGGAFITNTDGSELWQWFPFASAYTTVNSTKFNVPLKDRSRGQPRCV